MTPDIHPELRIFCSDMRDDMKELKNALVGTKLQTGLIPRVDKIETVQAEHGKKFLVWGTYLSIIGAAFVFAKDYFLKKS